MSTNIKIAIQEHDFSITKEHAYLRSASPNSGAIVTFTGLVRELSKQIGVVQSIELSVYQKLAENQINQIVERVLQRFDLDAITIIHRFGRLQPQSQIVFIGVASKHRADAFSAAEMLMDYLKSQVAFWKKETSNNANKKISDVCWITPTNTDKAAVKRWEK